MGRKAIFGRSCRAFVRQEVRSGWERPIFHPDVHLIDGIKPMRLSSRPILAALFCATSTQQALAQTVDARPPTDAVRAAADLQGDDRDRFNQATRLFQSGAVAMAYQTAKPLVDAYPNNLAVQDLRCQLAAVRWLDKDALLAECAAYNRLAPHAASTPAPSGTVEPSPPATPSAPPPAPAGPSAPPATPTPDSTARLHDPTYLIVSAGLGGSIPYQGNHGSGTGLYVEGEYAVEPTNWFIPRAYAGLLLTFPNTSSCDSPGVPCDVSAKIGFVGVKARLIAPIPYVAPFFELGVGLSVGVLTTRTPQENDGSVNVAYHIPVTLGLALGKDHNVEVALGYLVHPTIQADGALAFSLSFPLQ
jgi:hypothetical protein